MLHFGSVICICFFISVVDIVILAILLNFCQQLLHLRTEYGLRAQLRQRRRIPDQIVKHQALRRELFLGADLLALYPLLALGVVLGASLLCLLLISEEPQVLPELYNGCAVIILNMCLLFFLVAKLV